MLCGYLLKSNEWSLNIVNGVRKHSLESKLECYLLACSLNKGENETVVDMEGDSVY